MKNQEPISILGIAWILIKVIAVVAFTGLFLDSDED